MLQIIIRITDSAIWKIIKSLYNLYMNFAKNCNLNWNVNKVSNHIVTTYLNKYGSSSLSSEADLTASSHTTHTNLNGNSRTAYFPECSSCKMHPQSCLDFQGCSFLPQTLIHMTSKLSCILRSEVITIRNL